jgi:anaphase-promoting complex subunit 8
VNASNIRDFETSVKLFKSIYADEPWSLDHTHIYSNALFVLGRYVELSDLASRCVSINRFSPETCCVLGNLWSLNGKHEQAVISFRRAIRMNPDMPSAWVLVGHEFVELRNPSAAIAAYLKAARVNSLDHRAWFGLGQVYDLLGSPAQAADYYRRAAELCPSDGRLWAALGAVFEAEEMHEHALDAYNNALSCPLPDSKLYFRVGRIMLSLGVRDDAIEAFYKFIGTRTDLDKVLIDDADTSVALLEIAKTMLDSMDSSGAAAVLKSISGLPSNEGKEALRLYTSFFGLS